MKSYCTDAENWHLHLAVFLAHKQCVVETEQMSAVETRQLRPVTPLVAPAAWPQEPVGHVSTEDICVCRQCLRLEPPRRRVAWTSADRG